MMQVTATFPEWAEPDLLVTHADTLITAAGEAQETAQTARTTWTGLAAVYHAPEQEQVLSAFDQVREHGNEAKRVAHVVGGALKDFAEDVRGLLMRRTALLADIGSHNTAEQTAEEPDAGTYWALQERIGTLLADYEAAELRCAASINGAFAPAPTPGFLSTDAFGMYTGLAEDVVDRVHHQRLYTPKDPALYPLEDGAPLTWPPGAPLHVDELAHDFIGPDGKKYVTLPSGFAVEAGSAADPQIRPQAPINMTAFHEPGTRLVADPEMASPPAWARNAGRGLFALDVGITVWDEGSSQWNADLQAHPEWDTGQRVASAGATVAIVGGSSLAGGAAGAWAGAQAGAAIGALGGPVGVAAGAVIGGLVGGFVGSQAGEWVGGKAKDLWDSLWD
jgi:hypothetical protein